MKRRHPPTRLPHKTARPYKSLFFIFFSFFFIGVLLASAQEKIENTDNFWESFTGYFSISQPEQTMSKKIYEKPADGTSIAVPVIVYHSVRPHYFGETEEVKRYTVNPDTLDREFAYLRDNNYHVVPLDALANYFDEGVPLPTNPIVLTFDDGWKNQYDYAYPILKKYGFTATFFVFTNAIGHKNFLTWEDLIEMDKSGMTIGGHTKTHPYLTKITNPFELEKEISGGKQIIEEHLGHPIKAFAYPFGLYDEQTIIAVEKAGYHIARTSKSGFWHTKNSLLELSAVYDHNSGTLFENLSKQINREKQFILEFNKIN